MGPEKPLAVLKSLLQPQAGKNLNSTSLRPSKTAQVAGEQVSKSDIGSSKAKLNTAESLGR